MLVYSPADGRFIVDPHLLSIIPFKKLHATKCGEEKLIWIYHMYNPHSTFRDYKNSEKSSAIVQATFPKKFIADFETSLQMIINEATKKNKDIDELSDTSIDEKGETITVKKPSQVFVPKLRLYDPSEQEEMQPAIEWYINHLKQTPLWYAYESYKESMYNLSSIIRKKEATASEIKTASNELDTIPLKMEKMRKQAEKDEAMVMKVAGNQQIRRGEKVGDHAAQKAKNELKSKDIIS